MIAIIGTSHRCCWLVEVCQTLLRLTVNGMIPQAGQHFPAGHFRFHSDTVWMAAHFCHF